MELTLSKPSKIPGYAYGIPAKACITGAKLAKVEGSTCSRCYALRGNYRFRHVQAHQQTRLDSLSLPTWVADMVTAINAKVRIGVPYFRWHDSGDLQGLWHLRMIANVCERTPKVRHWLPTREYAMVRSFLAAYGAFPKNLVVRVSAHMVDDVPPKGFAHTSTVSKVKPMTRMCPAPSQDNKCGSCRACWDKRVKNVSYKAH